MLGLFPKMLGRHPIMLEPFPKIMGMTLIGKCPSRNQGTRPKMLKPRPKIKGLGHEPNYRWLFTKSLLFNWLNLDKNQRPTQSCWNGHLTPKWQNRQRVNVLKSHFLSTTLNRAVLEILIVTSQTLNQERRDIVASSQWHQLRWNNWVILSFSLAKLLEIEMFRQWSLLGLGKKEERTHKNSASVFGFCQGSVN